MLITFRGQRVKLPLDQVEAVVVSRHNTQITLLVETHRLLGISITGFFGSNSSKDDIMAAKSNLVAQFLRFFAFFFTPKTSFTPCLSMSRWYRNITNNASYWFCLQHVSRPKTEKYFEGVAFSTGKMGREPVVVNREKKEGRLRINCQRGGIM